MEWVVQFCDEFALEIGELPEEVSDRILAVTRLLRVVGPNLGRPRADTLPGSRHSNMKELRLEAANGVWRLAFAFDPERKAILLIAGDKSGVGEKRFYRELIRKADDRFDTHLESLKKKERGQWQ